jgi:hypothetical protein
VHRTPDPTDPAACSKVAPEVRPLTERSEPPPRTSDDAIKLAIKLAVDAGEYERATALLDVAKRTTKGTNVATLAVVRERRRET